MCVCVCVCVWCKVEANDERIDVERLKVRDKIGFYSDVMLFEDELHDSGCSVLSVKIVRCTNCAGTFHLTSSDFILTDLISS